MVRKMADHEPLAQKSLFESIMRGDPKGLELAIRYRYLTHTNNTATLIQCVLQNGGPAHVPGPCKIESSIFSF